MFSSAQSGSNPPLRVPVDVVNPRQEQQEWWEMGERWNSKDG